MCNILKFSGFFVLSVGLILAASYTETSTEAIIKKQYQPNNHVIQIGEFSYIRYAADVPEEHHAKVIDSVVALSVK